MRSIVIFRFFSHLSLLFVYQCITFLPLIFRFSFYRLAQLRAVVLISFSGYPVFLRWNNAHESLIVVGCYCGGD